MGQLTNQFVSQSYQGLLNLENANTGVTATLQYVTDGVGNRLPMQASTSSIVISGSFYGDGSNLTGITSTTAVSASYANYASQALSSSFATNAATASFATNVVSSSFATNALSASYAQNATSASYATNAATASIANDLIVRCKNDNPSTLVRGTIVRISGADGNNPLINTASWIDDNNSANTLGMLSEDVATNDFANVVVQGKVEGINTNGMTAGAMLYLSSSGQYTTQIVPAPYHEVRLGQVLRVNTNNGSAYISIDNGYELSELHDVDITNPVNGDLLVYRSGSYGQWVNESASEIGIATTGSLSGYTTITAFNNYTASNDSKVNSLIAGTGSYATTSSLTALSQSIATTDLSQDNRLTALESVTGSINRNGLITTGSIGQTQSITGSLNVEGTISATSASFTYVTTTYETASVIYSSGSNQLGDASNDTQTLYGTVVLPNGPLVITGSVTATNFTGSLQGTASNALSASYSDYAVTASYALNAVIPSGTISGSAQIIDLGFATTSSVNTLSGSIATTDLGQDNRLTSLEGATGSLQNQINQKLDTGSFNTYTSSVNQQLTALNLETGSLQNQINQKLDTGSFNSYTSSNDSKVNSLISQTGSYVTETESGSFMTTGSVSGNVLTFTKGDGSTFDLTVATGSGGGTIDTGSFATTGSNVFRGNQVLTGSFSQTGSMTIIGNSSNPSAVITRIGDSAFGVVEITNNGQLTATNVIKATSIQNWNTVGSSQIEVINTLGSISLIPKTVAGNVNLGANTSSIAIVSGSMDVRGGSLDLFSNGTTVNTDLYLTNSVGGQSNVVLGWGDNLGAGGASAVQANYTGSLRVTGSANILSMPIIRPTLFGGGTDMQGYISGSGNILTSNLGGIFLNTGSQLFPKTQNNYLGNGSAILMNFTTSSLAGGHPTVTNNIVLGGNILINHNSGSLTGLGQNAILGGSMSSTQNFVTNTRPQIAANNVIGAVTLNHISSSINYTSNYNNSPVTINNHLSSSNITNNSLTFTNNAVFGGSSNTGLGLWVSGSQSSNATRTISDNLIGGRNIIISSSFVSSSNSNLISSLIYGQNLIVSGSHASAGGSAFLGRYNDATSLHLAQDIVFAVGTGTAAGSRRTGLYVTSGSLVGVSGSLLVSGSSTFNGKTAMSSSDAFPLYVSGTIQTQRLQFDGNAFNTNPASNLGALRLDGNNAAFQLTNYNKAEITSGSALELYVSTGSNYVHSQQSADYNNTSAKTTLGNANGTRNFDVKVDTMTITGSVNMNSIMNLAPQNPLPSGVLGDLAVSSSAELYFNNGSGWNLIV